MLYFFIVFDFRYLNTLTEAEQLEIAITRSLKESWQDGDSDSDVIVVEALVPSYASVANQSPCQVCRWSVCI